MLQKIRNHVPLVGSVILVYLVALVGHFAVACILF
jgi:hypothetical protein